ncbi:hypothetical protein GJ744_008205 [Endocarpon pusillum]|uniref:Uncharacterized protein n=1 Tax=Endocarpon pusillum TaxID=364733 RepID=A0A8H7ALK2_9EURO|nr:hypothetical protein GJ744_008205 [Endocarpon pusillum]
MVAGSDPNEMTILPQDVDPGNPARAFPTEFRIEIYTPPYLKDDRARKRPDRISLSQDKLTVDGSTFEYEVSGTKRRQRGSVGAQAQLMPRLVK